MDLVRSARKRGVDHWTNQVDAAELDGHDVRNQVTDRSRRCLPLTIVPGFWDHVE
jgi:hypothetical protein